MSAKVENLEHSMVKLTVEVTADKFINAIQRAFKKNRNKS